MFVFSNRFFSRLLVALTLIFIVTGCNGSGNGFPQIANPPPFDYVDGQELRAGMHQLAFELQQLEMMLASQGDEGRNFQRDIVSSLRDLERMGENIETRDLSTTHTFLRDDMSRFLSSVTRARIDAERMRRFESTQIKGGSTGISIYDYCRHSFFGLFAKKIAGKNGSIEALNKLSLNPC